MSTLTRSARDPDPPGFPADTGGLRGVPAPGVGVGAPAPVPDLRTRRVLRLVPAAARSRARLRNRPPDRAVLRAGRELALVLCRRNLRLIAAPARRRGPATRAPAADRLRARPAGGGDPRPERGVPAAERRPDRGAELTGARRPARPDEILFAEGDRNCDFFVVLDGLVAMWKPAGHRRNASSACMARAASSASSAC